MNTDYEELEQQAALEALALEEAVAVPAEDTPPDDDMPDDDMPDEVVNSPVMGAKYPKAYTGKLLALRKALQKGK